MNSTDVASETRTRSFIGRAVPFSELFKAKSVSAKNRGDVWLYLIISAITCFGLVMVYSASDATGYLWYGNANYFFERQVGYVVVGLVGMVVMSRIDYHFWKHFTKVIVGVMLVMLIAVLIPHIGTSAYGASRWFSLGSFSIQPSSVAVVVAILVFSHWLVMKRHEITTLHGVRDYCILFGCLMGLILMEKDMGTTIVIAVVGFTLLYLAGAKARHVALVVVALGLATLVMIKMESYRGARLSSFTNPFAAAQTTGYQEVQAQYAFGSGGVFGSGLGNSIEKYGWLPSAQTDFIFAVVGEELGLIGSLSVVAAFMFLASRGIRAARRAPDQLGMLIAGGITVWVAFGAIINMSAVTGLIPTTGIPLPFISYGGSDLIMTLCAMGILLNVASQGHRKGVTRRAHSDRWWGDWRPFNAGTGTGGNSQREFAKR